MSKLLTLSVLLLSTFSMPALSTVILPDTDYMFSFTGQVTGVDRAEGPAVVEAPMLALGDPIHGIIGFDWIDDPAFRDSYVSGTIADYPIPAIDHAHAWFATTPDVPYDSVAFGILCCAGGFTFDLVTGEVLAVEGDGYAGITFEKFHFRWGLDGGIIQQIANADGLTEPSHWFTYGGSWEAVRLRPVPEPGPWLLLAGGLLGLVCVARRRRGAPLSP